MKRLHNLLARQLARLSLQPEAAPDVPNWLTLLERVSQTYADVDQDRYLIERSQDISSREMQELYDALQRERDHLESRVAERTAALAASEARFRSLTSMGSDWYWEQDRDFRFTSIAGNTELYAGHTIAGHIGRTRWDIDGYEPPEGGWEAHRATLESHRPFRDLMLRFRLADGSVAWAMISGEPVFAADGTFAGYRGIGRDITPEKRAEERVHRLARFDPLTGLFNRPMFFERLDHALAVARRRGTAAALLFIDLDRFKNINDTFGHLTGDEVLRTMAGRLAGAVRETDTLARLGGDEFIVLAENFAAPTDASELAQRSVETLAEPVALAGTECHLGASIGHRDVPRRRRRRRDAAQERRHRDVPRQGRRPQQLPVLLRSDEPAADRAAWCWSRAARALDQERVRPALPAEGRRRHRRGSSGVEALIRWQHPGARPAAARPVHPGRRGDRPDPADRRWVLRAALRAGQAWRDAGLPPIPVAVNLSAREFNDERLASRSRRRSSTRISTAHLLELEITESLVMQDPDRAVEMLRAAQVDGRAHLDRRLRHRLLVAGASCRSCRSTASRSTGVRSATSPPTPTTRRSPRR